MDYIFTYTRNQAIQDGFLADLTPLACKIGLRGSVAVTNSVWEDYIAIGDEQASCSLEFQFAERAALILRAAYQAMCHEQQKGVAYDNELLFRFDLAIDGKKQEIELKIIAESDEKGEGVLTILKPDED
jgi:hypothetical protein